MVGRQQFYQHSVLVFWKCKQKMHEFSTVVWVQNYYFSCNPKSQNFSTSAVPIIRSNCTSFLAAHVVVT
jgi:hypothetical protein